MINLRLIFQDNLTNTVGSLTGGSISGNFGSISTTNEISTTSTMSANSITGGAITLSGSVISHSSDPSLITLASGKVTIAGEVKTNTLTLGNTTVNSTANDLNKLYNLTTTKEHLTHVFGATDNIQDQLNARDTSIQVNNKLDNFTGQSNIVTVGDLTSGSIGGSLQQLIQVILLLHLPK